MAEVNLVAWDNGVGLSRDMHLIAEVLGDAGIRVTATRIRRGKLNKWFRPWLVRIQAASQQITGRKRHCLNLMLEHIRPQYLPLADVNALVPNPEWFMETDEELLHGIDRILAKTGHAARIFLGKGCDVREIGFTSVDRHDASVRRERKFFHLAGRSGGKNTALVLELWRKHPEWPQLTVIQSRWTAAKSAEAPNIVHRVDYVGDAELRWLQNSHRFHLCPSIAEGFGHYIVEALSTGAVTLATDGEPMNELVTTGRGILVPVASEGVQQLSRTFHVDEATLQAAVEAALVMDDAECDEIGRRARAFYLQNDMTFRRRLVEVVAETLADARAHRHDRP